MIAVKVRWLNQLANYPETCCGSHIRSSILAQPGNPDSHFGMSDFDKLQYMHGSFPFASRYRSLSFSATNSSYVAIKLGARDG